jgi:hypothetical protein
LHAIEYKTVCRYSAAAKIVDKWKYSTPQYSVASLQILQRGNSFQFEYLHGFEAICIFEMASGYELGDKRTAVLTKKKKNLLNLDSGTYCTRSRRRQALIIVYLRQIKSWGFRKKENRSFLHNNHKTGSWENLPQIARDKNVIPSNINYSYSHLVIFHEDDMLPV